MPGWYKVASPLAWARGGSWHGVAPADMLVPVREGAAAQHREQGGPEARPAQGRGRCGPSPGGAQ